ncbi:MAG: hypothetical protein M1458_01255 [Deltaproteobacteria bacterium]|nr:hypothetical protein [Deltaproteobacteria bacterium]
MSLVLRGNFHATNILPNMPLIALIYISAYIDVYPGAALSYLIFYIYGSMTALNPAVFPLAGIVSYAVSYILWRKVSSKNGVNEILITFLSSTIYYLMLFLIVFYSLGMHFNYWNFFLFYSLPVSIITSLISPLLFFIFKKIGYKNFLKRNRIILD